jgi:hypothetical protein
MQAPGLFSWRGERLLMTAIAKWLPSPRRRRTRLAPMKPAPHTVVSTRLLVVMNKPIDMLYVFGLIR